MENKQYFTQIKFKGKAGEYFSIWIVNLFLSILTLGIYSAWAKVRSYRYFYSSTFLQDSSFEYSASPIRILIGRVIIVVVYFAYAIVSDINPLIGVGLFGLFLIFIPWIIYNSIRFKLRYSSYKNINFSLNKSAGRFFLFFFLHSILALFTLGFSLPYSYNKFTNLIVSNSNYGNSNFKYGGETSYFYYIFMKYILLTIAIFASLGVVVSILLPTISKITHNDAPSESIGLAISIVIFLIYFFMIFIGFLLQAYFQSRVKNYVWKSTSINEIDFRGTLSARKLAWIYTTNFIVILLTLGLATPWAKIRTLKYKLECLYVEQKSLDEFLNSSAEQKDSLGEEAGDMFDIDVGI